MNKYAIATHSGTFNVWSGPFADVWEGDGTFRNDARQTTVTLHNGDKVRVTFPDGIRLPRHDGNYLAIDKAISDAIEAHYAG